MCRVPGHQPNLRRLAALVCLAIVGFMAHPHYTAHCDADGCQDSPGMATCDGLAPCPLHTFLLANAFDKSTPVQPAVPVVVPQSMPRPELPPREPAVPPNIQPRAPPSPSVR